MNPRCAASTGVAKADKGGKTGTQRITGKIWKHLMFVENSFHVLVQRWPLGTGVSARTRVPAAEAVSAGGKRSPAGWRNVLGKHCWPRRVLLFSLEYDQLCGQRSSRDVVGLMQSWSGLFQQTAWFRVSFWFFVRFFFSWKMSVKQKQSQYSNSVVPVCSEESLEQTRTCTSDTEGECSDLLDCRIPLLLI